MQVLDQMYGLYMPEHILVGYMFLMKNYVAGNNVHLFGLGLHYNPVVKLLIHHNLLIYC
jgi:uncharacterized protein (DUF2235 family)